jgi:hypothetical protein
VVNSEDIFKLTGRDPEGHLPIKQEPEVVAAIVLVDVIVFLQEIPEQIIRVSRSEFRAKLFIPILSDILA